MAALVIWLTCTITPKGELAIFLSRRSKQRMHVDSVVGLHGSAYRHASCKATVDLI